MDKIDLLKDELLKLQLNNQNRRTHYYNGRKLVQMQISNILKSSDMTLSRQLSKLHPKFKILLDVLSRLDYYQVQGVNIQVKHNTDFKDGIFEMKQIILSILKPHLDIIQEAHQHNVYRVITSKLINIYDLCNTQK